MADIRINSLPTTASASSSDDFLALDGATNGTRKLNAYSPTFGGNLTVSGKIIGGNSSDSGAISTLRSSGAATGLANVKASSALTVVDNTTANTDSAMVFGVNGSGAYIQGLYTTVASTITLQPYGGSTTLGGNLTVSGTGNSSVAGTLLVATTTNSSNGKIQLATHSTSAGGIGFGTETSLYRIDTGALALDHVGGSAPRFVLRSNGTIASNLEVSSGDLFFDNRGVGKSLYLRTTTSGGTTTTALTLDSSQRCILAGALRLNNAYVSGAPTATGYVTLQDSAGNTYKVLVGT
jgi:hypothetical protein